MELTTQSIEKALALCGKTMEDMKEITDAIDCETNNSYFRAFSIEKFFAFLLSPELVDKYYYTADKSSEGYGQWEMPNLFGSAIYEYQKGNDQSLQDLLNKIP